MSANWVADLWEALGHDASALRHYDPPRPAYEDRDAFEDLEARLAAALERNEDLAQAMCGRCRRKAKV